jgi:hypothetical protein
MTMVGTYREYLKDTRVILVCPSPSVKNKKEFIDSFDIVVRVNSSVPVVEEKKIDIGTRCDILYHVLSNAHYLTPNNPTFDIIEYMLLLKQRDLHWVCSAYPRKYGPNVPQQKQRIETFEKFNTFYFDTYFNFRVIQNKLMFWLLTKLFGATPNVGITAISDLLLFDIKELYITGLTFFYDGYFDKYSNYWKKETVDKLNPIKSNNSGGHCLPIQIKLLQEIYQRNKNRIKLDPILEEILAMTEYEIDRNFGLGCNNKNLLTGSSIYRKIFRDFDKSNNQSANLQTCAKDEEKKNVDNVLVHQK